MSWKPWAPLNILRTSCFTAGVFMLAMSGFASSSLAQGSLEAQNAAIVPDDGEMTLTADQLLYHKNRDEIEAAGNVDILYQGNRLIADRVIYKRGTGQVIAKGNVQLFDGSDNTIRAASIDVTDDFQKGFVQSVELHAPQFGLFQAESGERLSETSTRFDNAKYTPCRVCNPDSDKPSLWHVKAKTIIIDEDRKTVLYEDATFALLGQSLLTLPKFSHADPRANRVSGFLRPFFNSSPETGPSVGVPYFMVLSEKTDLTVTGVAHAFQGLMSDVEFRHAIGSGYYTLRGAGIHQFNPEAFDQGSVDRRKDWRGLVASTGQFRPSSNWAFDWNIMAQSDRTFARTYSVQDYDKRVVTNNISLKGLDKSNYAELSAFQFLVQDSDESQGKQALLAPRLTYERYVRRGDFGTLKASLNSATYIRDDEHSFAAGSTTKYEGLQGHSARVNAELAWNHKFSLGGLAIKPILSARGDIYTYETNSSAAIANKDQGALGMVTAGAEISYPLLLETANSSHIIEPVAQILVRPNEMRAGKLPNNDAQSLVFDSTNLFQHNKFSGNDRIEGGTRTNYGLRYSASFANGLNLAATAGQSVHLAGKNSFATHDVANTGMHSGLETKVSDIVTGLHVGYLSKLSAEVKSRFNEDSKSLQRLESSVNFDGENVDFSIGHSFVTSQAELGFSEARNSLSASTKVQLNDQWSVGSSATYDLAAGAFVGSNIGVGYQADAGFFGINYSRQENNYTDDAVNQNLEFEVRLFPFD